MNARDAHESSEEHRREADLATEDVEFQNPEFEEYLGYHEPIARGMARRPPRTHPCLEEEDLFVAALELCLRIWLGARARNPVEAPAALYPLAVCAMDRGLKTVYARATKWGEARARIVSFDAPARPSSTRPLSEELVDIPPPAPPAIDRLAPPGPHRLLRLLSAREEIVLQELVSPSPRTARACVELWASPERGRRNWPTVRSYALAWSLDWPLREVRETLVGLSSAVVWSGPSGERRI